MLIGKVSFDFVCEIKPERKPAGNIDKYFPQSRYANKKNLPPNKYGQGPFCYFSIPEVYSGKSGVYLIKVDENIVYIGECVDFEDRFNTGYGIISPRNCFEGGQETNCRINNLILQTSESGSKISLYFCETSNRKSIESQLIDELKPEWNRARK